MMLFMAAGQGFLPPPWHEAQIMVVRDLVPFLFRIAFFLHFQSKASFISSPAFITMSFGEESAVRPFEWLTSPASLLQILSSEDIIHRDDKVDGTRKKRRSALHVGSGSSILGEYLVERLGYEKVWDIDKDEATLATMRQRWKDRCQRVTGMDEQRLEHIVVDFVKNPIPIETASCSLVLDKSTLDCTLCSEDATAALLTEVYRCLQEHGVYVLISFHEKDLIIPLLQELPGAVWEVMHRQMDRQVETLTEMDDCSRETVPTVKSSCHPPLNVLICKKNVGEHNLSMEEIRAHVHRVNDSWFQTSRPLLTRQREQELQKRFVKALPLKEAYNHLFTEAEREHLEFEYFLEDWHAFCESHNLPKACDEEAVLGYELAIEFLTEMQ